MGWISNTTVRTRLIGGFLVVAAISAVIGALGIRSTQQMNQMASHMYEQELLGVVSADEARLHIVAAGRALRNTLLAPDAGVHVTEFLAMESRFDSLVSVLDKLEDTFDSAQDKKLVQDALKAVEQYKVAVGSLVTQNQADLPSQEVITERLFSDVRTRGNTAEMLIGMLTAQKQNAAQQYSNEIAGIYRTTLYSLIALTFGGAILAIILGWLITRVLTRQLGGEPRDVARTAVAIAQGNLTSKIDTRKATVGSVVHAMNQMQESLRKVVAAVRGSSDHIATGSNQIAVGNTDLSQRTEEQAANLTQTASAMEELSSTVKNNADVARQAADMASSASASATRGGEVVNDVVSTMHDIDSSSRKVVDIIGVIDSIAFQTNILALNAAVEAARAGEQGRGFAVVASEVRSLAQKSASAARDVKQLIDDSAQKVEAGGKMVDAAGAAMADIVTQVRRVTDLINEISAATVEQTSGLNQINDAVAQLSGVTQQNASLVVQSAAAADSLRDQARRLVDVVGVFNIGHEFDEHVSSSDSSEYQREEFQNEEHDLESHEPRAPRLGAPALGVAAAAGGFVAALNDDWDEF